MKMLRLSTVIINVQLMLLIACGLFLWWTMTNNWFLKEKAKILASQVGSMEAREHFIRGRRWLLEIKSYRYTEADGKVPSDGEWEFTDRHEGVFQIVSVTVEEALPAAHEIWQAYADAYNRRMHLFFEKPELFDTNGFRAFPENKVSTSTNTMPSSNK